MTHAIAGDVAVPTRKDFPETWLWESIDDDEYVQLRFRHCFFVLNHEFIDSHSIQSQFQRHTGSAKKST